MKKYEQLKKLYTTLDGYIDQYNDSEAMVSGAAADFDRLFELAWKTIKEYLQKEKMMLEAKSGSPKDIIKLAYREGIIDQEILWIDMLEDRNDDSHHYRKSDAILYISKIQGKYLSAIKDLIDYFSDKIPQEQLEEIEIPADIIEYCRTRNLFLIDFADDLCERYGYENYNQLYKNWDEIKREL